MEEIQKDLKLHQAEPFNLRHHEAKVEVKVEKPRLQMPEQSDDGQAKRKISLPAILISLFILIVTVLAIGTLFYVKQNQNKVQAINNFEDCVAAGNPIMESYPEQCAANGQTFTRTLTEEEQKKLDPTASWETYENTELGYSIKHPPEITFKSDRFYLIGDDNRKDTADGFGPNLSIYLRFGDSPKDAAEDELGKDRILKDLTINGYSSVQVVDSGLGGFDYYISSPDGKILRTISFSQDYSPTVSKESIAKMDLIAKQMLSTFKFTGQNSTTDTSDWKTYSNNELGFFIKYPPNWRFQETLVGGSIYSSDWKNNEYKAGDETGSSMSFRKLSNITLDDLTYNLDPNVLKKINILGYEAIQIKIADDSDLHKSKVTTYIRKDNEIYAIDYLDFDEDFMDEQIYYQLLSTFKFTQ